MMLRAKANSATMCGDKSKQECFNECKNMSFHGLAAQDNPSVEIMALLRLGPKSSIKSRGVKISNTIIMIDAFKRDTRMKDYLISNSFDEYFETQR